jgi:hypothetical protein
MAMGTIVMIVALQTVRLRLEWLAVMAMGTIVMIVALGDSDARGSTD